ncbi:MAG: AAA family ATPase [Deltaproteobacteria bacterium GWA2_55_10]|nr:MAG: AAA family ATPase [Deltaproteobacteria bacterium GWA2_55_10]
MLNTQTMDKLRELKLTGMLRALEEQTSSAGYDDLGFEERLGLLVDRKVTERGNRRLQARLRKAKLRQQACMEDIDYRHSRGLDRSVMRSLATCRWIKDRHNVIITGPTGAGKSFISCALAHRACLEGYAVAYYRAPRLFQELSVARGDGRYARLMNAISRVHLLVIDDWGLSVLTEPERKDFLKILEDRHGVHSTIVAGQLPVDHWHETIGNPTLADAILDRLVHNAYKINLKGESMRKKKNSLDSKTDKG